MCRFCDEAAEDEHEKRQDRHRGRNFPGPFAKTPGRLIGLAVIRLYQLTLSSLVGSHCRHLPTCSEYGYEAVARHGLWFGGWLILFRVARCGPGGSWGIDPVPADLGPARRAWRIDRLWLVGRKPTRTDGS